MVASVRKKPLLKAEQILQLELHTVFIYFDFIK